MFRLVFHSFKWHKPIPAFSRLSYVKIIHGCLFTHLAAVVSLCSHTATREIVWWSQQHTFNHQRVPVCSGVGITRLVFPLCGETLVTFAYTQGSDGGPVDPPAAPPLCTQTIFNEMNIDSVRSRSRSAVAVQVTLTGRILGIFFFYFWLVTDLVLHKACLKLHGLCWRINLGRANTHSCVLADD